MHYIVKVQYAQGGSYTISLHNYYGVECSFPAGQKFAFRGREAHDDLLFAHPPGCALSAGGAQEAGARHLYLELRAAH